VRPSTELRRFVWVVVAAGLVATVVSLAGASWPDWGPNGLAITILLIAGIVAGEWLPARIWRGDNFREYTFSGTFTVALIITGPFWLALVVQTGALLFEEVRERRPVLKVAFNLSQYALSMAGAVPSARSAS